jgi:hypothetical protein
MLTWILTASLYGLGMGAFALIGGIRAAGDAFRRWGEGSSRRPRALSPSS